MIIYKITNQINNKKYIGYDTNGAKESRWRRHQIAGRRKKAVKWEGYSYLYNAMRFYGVENFTYEIIDQANTIEELKNKEIYWIAHYNTFLGEGYNMTPGGDGGIGNKSFLENATPEKLEEYSQLLSRKVKGHWNSLHGNERQNRIDNAHQWLKTMSDSEKEEHYKKVGIGVSKWRQSLTKEENDELNHKNSQGVKKYWESLSDEEIQEWGQRTSKTMTNVWSNMDPEEKKRRISKGAEKKRHTFLFFSPEGNKYIVKNIKEFCKKYNLSHGQMRRVAKSGKKHKGWTAQRIKNEINN